MRESILVLFYFIDIAVVIEGFPAIKKKFKTNACHIVPLLSVTNNL